MEAFKMVVLATMWLNVESLKILAIFGHSGTAHFYAFNRLLEGLNDRGHSLTVLSYFPLQQKRAGYKDIVLADVSQREIQDLKMAQHRWWSQYTDLAKVRRKSPNQECIRGLSSKGYVDLLNSDEKFDLIIAEYFVWNCLLVPFVDKLKVPVVGVIPNAMMPWTYKWFATPNNPAYITPVISYGNCAGSFFNKLDCVFKLLYSVTFYEFFIQKDDKQYVNEFLGKDVDFDSILLNTSLLLTNSHYSFLDAKPLVPNVVEVGGIHIGQAQPLPTHLEKWINESTHGVIYFSLGSMIKGHTFPEEKRQMFLRAFARFPQRILWKWETDTMPGKPENVMIDKWMPQFDILSHPNVKAFIAHGGLLGVTEAVHCGVPLIIMPQFGDQFTNAKAVEASGGGVILDYRSLDEESIYNALKTVLDPSFNKKAKELSARFRDRPMPPLETAIYWVEYVARHGGAPHLRTAAVGMPLYQYLLLDVIAFLAVVLLTIMYISFIVTRAIFRRIFKTNKVEKVKKN